MIVIVKAMLVVVIMGAMVMILMGINQLSGEDLNTEEECLSPVCQEVEQTNPAISTLNRFRRRFLGR